MIRLPTGASFLDRMLHGGYESGCITTLYGPAGTGKTTLCLLAAIEALKKGIKVLYIDSEGGFSPERLQQLSPDAENLIQQIIFLRPTLFSEQRKAFEKLKEQAEKTNLGLIIVDTIAMLYRMELGQAENVYEINRDLGRQIALITALARNKDIPIIITNQVYSMFDERDKVNMVGGDIMQYGSKCLLELQKTPENHRRIILRKHRSIPDGIMTEFEIKGFGLVEAKTKFKLF